MKRIFIDKAVLDSQTVLAENGLPAQSPVGYAYDVHNQPLVLFVSTDKETGQPHTDVNGKIALNVRASRRSS